MNGLTRGSFWLIGSIIEMYDLIAILNSNTFIDLPRSETMLLLADGLENVGDEKTAFALR